MALLSSTTRTPALMRLCDHLRSQAVNLGKLSTFNYSTDNTTIPKNSLEEVNTASQQAEKGVVYDKKPFKMTCTAGKKYAWCVCGKSKSQPLCDGTHKNVFLKIKFRPVRFEVKETKDYYLCNCKQTSNRPFCDGTHKLEFVQGTSVKPSS